MHVEESRVGSHAPAAPASAAGPGARQAELVRVARGPDGTLAVGRTLPGRGAWLCQASLPCFDAAVRRRGFAKALRVQVDAAELGRLRTNFVPSGPAARD